MLHRIALCSNALYTNSFVSILFVKNEILLTWLMMWCSFITWFDDCGLYLVLVIWICKETKINIVHHAFSEFSVCSALEVNRSDSNITHFVIQTGKSNVISLEIELFEFILFLVWYFYNKPYREGHCRTQNKSKSTTCINSKKC